MDVGLDESGGCIAHFVIFRERQRPEEAGRGLLRLPNRPAKRCLGGLTRQPPQSVIGHLFFVMRFARPSLDFMNAQGTLPILSAPVAQLDRASDYGSEGCVFESRRVHCSTSMTYALKKV